MAKTSKLEKRAAIQGGLTAKNSIETALRLSDWDLMNYNTSLSSANAYNNVSIELLSLRQTLLTFLYKTFGILAKIVDLPVEEAYKNGGFKLNADTINEDEIQDLENAILDNNDIEEVKTAHKWARLYGGAAIIAITDNEELDTPLNYNNLQNKRVKLLAVDRWQLAYSEPNINIRGGKWQKVNNADQNGSKLIDDSRIFLIKGKRAPYIVEQMTQGWGMSVFEHIFQDMAQFFKARNVLFELLDEAKTDVIKLATIETALGSAQGERALQKMVDMIARNKNYKSQLTLSTKDEYEQKQISFGGIAEILKEIRVMMAGASEIPVNKIWGEGVTGFGSGEDSLENFNSMIDSQVRTPDNALWKWIFKIRCSQLFGRFIEDIEKTWSPLRILSTEVEQNINTQKITNVLQLYDRHLLSPSELMAYLKTENLFIQETKALNGELDDVALMNEAESTNEEE